jgi:hypothetical protein
MCFEGGKLVSAFFLMTAVLNEAANSVNCFNASSPKLKGE